MKAYAMIANGAEEVECLAVVDILKRGGIDCTLVSIEDSVDIVSSHKIKITADCKFTDVDLSDGDLLFMPGGMPGSERLSAYKPLIKTIEEYIAKDKYVAAICAAPGVVLGRHGFLKGKKATVFPGFEDEMIGAEVLSNGVVTDGKISTARGLGFAIDLGLELLSIMIDPKFAEDIKGRIQYNY